MEHYWEFIETTSEIYKEKAVPWFVEGLKSVSPEVLTEKEKLTFVDRVRTYNPRDPNDKLEDSVWNFWNRSKQEALRSKGTM